MKLLTLIWCFLVGCIKDNKTKSDRQQVDLNNEFGEIDVQEIDEVDQPEIEDGGEVSDPAMDIKVYDRGGRRVTARLSVRGLVVMAIAAVIAFTIYISLV